LKLALIGSGQVATHLGKALETAGHQITEVFSRSLNHADLLARQLYQASPTTHPDFSHSQAQVFLLCVADDAYAELLPRLVFPKGAIVAHTSGSLPMLLLAPYALKFGVLYPLQTFSRHQALDLAQVPFCIEASDEQVRASLRGLAGDLSRSVYDVSTAERQSLHLAAVFACNFANHLLTIAQQLLAEQELDFALLHPLVRETLAKALRAGPNQSQTGPAVRGDQRLMAQHLARLAPEHPAWAAIYQAISQDIGRFYGKL
jgi:predicted short-subunit dehydrogenase-like oxidoreductase (DUF2520 family)